YHEANKRQRKTPPPPRFSARFPLDKFPIDEGWLETSARDDLRRSIADSQAVLVGQVQAIHAEFERAFASYREIDELVEEKTFARSDAKAAWQEPKRPPEARARSSIGAARAERPLGRRLRLSPRGAPACTRSLLAVPGGWPPFRHCRASRFDGRHTGNRQA